MYLLLSCGKILHFKGSTKNTVWKTVHHNCTEIARWTYSTPESAKQYIKEARKKGVKPCGRTDNTRKYIT